MGYHESYGISKSGLDLIHKNPAEYKYFYIDKNVKKSTLAMEFGSAFHMAVLEGDTCNNAYTSDEVGLLAGSRSTKKFKEIIQDIKENQPDTKIIKKEDYDKIMHIKDALMAHRGASELLREGVVESAVRWNWGKVSCKCKPDMRTSKYIIDLKTTVDASTFEKSIRKFRYAEQCAFYQWGCREALGEALQFIFIVIEKEAPFGIRIVKLDDDYIKWGHESIMHDLDIYKTCLENNLWPNYEDEIITIEKPDYLSVKKNVTVSPCITCAINVARTSLGIKT